MKLRIQCPHPPCARRLAPVEVGFIATDVFDRTCRYCGARWRLVVRPMKAVANGRGFAHELRWTCTKDATHTRCGECDACQEYILTPNQAPSCTSMRRKRPR